MKPMQKKPEPKCKCVCHCQKDTCVRRREEHKIICPHCNPEPLQSSEWEKEFEKKWSEEEINDSLDLTGSGNSWIIPFIRSLLSAQQQEWKEKTVKKMKAEAQFDIHHKEYEEGYRTALSDILEALRK